MQRDCYALDLHTRACSEINNSISTSAARRTHNNMPTYANRLLLRRNYFVCCIHAYACKCKYNFTRTAACVVVSAVRTGKCLPIITLRTPTRARRDFPKTRILEIAALLFFRTFEYFQRNVRKS